MIVLSLSGNPAMIVLSLSGNPAMIVLLLSGNPGNLINVVLNSNNPCILVLKLLTFSIVFAKFLVLILSPLQGKMHHF